MYSLLVEGINISKMIRNTQFIGLPDDAAESTIQSQFIGLVEAIADSSIYWATDFFGRDLLVNSVQIG